MPEKEKVYALRYKKDDSKLFYSTSGGAFLGFAEAVISEGGKVYGAAYNEKNEVVHIWINDIQDIGKLQGSKYVQSRMGSIYKSVRKDLEQGLEILFTGTPCQTAGLKSFLDKKYDNLLTLDFACHGVPSPAFFKAYLEWLEKRGNQKISSGGYTFRYKKYGWYYRRRMSYALKVNGKVRHVSSDPYYSNFLKGNCYRESCYNCPFHLENYQSDITVGDFSNVDKKYPQIMDYRGVSYAVLHTAKAERYLEKIKSQFISAEADYDFVVENNTFLRCRAVRPSERTSFYKGLRNHPAGFIEQLYKNINLKTKIKGFLLVHCPLVLARVWSGQSRSSCV